MIVPEQRNSIALKKAWVIMWRNARSGWFRPRVNIIRPNWLEVEKAMIFLISFWVSAHRAEKVVVTAPRQRQDERAKGFVSITG